MKIRAALFVSMLLATPAAAQVGVPTPAPAPTPAAPPLPPTAWQPFTPLAPTFTTEPFYFDDFSFHLDNLTFASVTPDIDFSLLTTQNLAFASQYADAAAFASTNTVAYASAADAFAYSFHDGVRAPGSWAPQDPADSLYRVAREHLNRGDYRRAATLFGDIERRHPTSTYGAAAMYYQAFALYRIGGTAELQQALTVLEAHRAKYPDDSTSKTPKVRTVGLTGDAHVVTTAGKGRIRADADALAARIASVLASRGLGANAAVKRALESSGNACDAEDQSVRASALSALMQTDPAGARALATRILTRRDECSAPLRRSAIFLIGGQQDEAGTTALIGVAKNDPSTEIRLEAINWLARMPSDAAVSALEELATGAGDERVQRAAVRALAMHPSPRARTATRGLVERNDGPENLRLAAFDGLGGERASAEDAAWLRSIYPRVTSARVKERIVSTVGRMGGDANQQWLVALSRDENEPIASRTAALRRVATTMDIAQLGRLYDASAERSVRETLLSALANRTEPEAVDKLIDIARNGTDPSMRRMAISSLARSKDPRAAKLLLELVDR